MISRVRMLIDGAVAGVIGAVVMALWYLIFDAARGAPLNSAEALAGTLFAGFGPGVQHAQVGTEILGHVVFYLCVFALIGIAAAVLLEAAEADTALFATMLVFVIAFEIFSIMIMMLLGPSSAVSQPWWKFIIGDLMATAAMLAFFLERHPTLARQLEGPWMGVADEGAIAGVIGAIVVAVWFLIYDAAAGHMFLTPALLGAAIFQGVFDPGQVAVTLPLVLGYTALHFFAFILFGIATAILLRAADAEPAFAVGALFLLAIFEVFFVGALAAFDRAALDALGFWKILAGNVVAIAAMLVYFSRRHRGWIPRLLERWESLQRV
ncbi:MAG TPA: hypothetical protein VFB33_11025 [Candidatus Binataceae bacterium]|jgi:hypothetical protein|nr:hypothetical protein [Candidatus Binataceae bacterium]